MTAPALVGLGLIAALMLSVLSGWLGARPASAAPVVPAAACTPSPVTDPMTITYHDDPNPIRAWDTVRFDIKGQISDGHCAGDSFRFTLPGNLTPPNGGSWQVTAPDGAVVATMKAVDDSIVVTLTEFVETHQNVSFNGWFMVQVRNETLPGGTSIFEWTVNGKTSRVSIDMKDCPNCTQMPTTPGKWGDSPGPEDAFYVIIQTGISDRTNQEYTVTDTLTSPGQAFDCSRTPQASYYTRTGPRPGVTRSTSLTFQVSWSSRVQIRRSQCATACR